jgi:hypothetical protein
MTRYGILALMVWLLRFSAAAQDQTGKQTSTSFVPSTPVTGDGSSLPLENGLAIQVVLVTPIDAKRNKKGSVVVAKTARDITRDGAVVLKRGSELRGHVTRVQAHSSQNANSTIGIVFDHVVAKGGHDLVPVNFSIQELAATRGQSTAAIHNGEEVITATGENVQLATGTQMILRVTQ